MGEHTTGITIDDVRVSAFTVPTDAPEADGTLAWKSTTMVLAEIEAGGHTGIGYTYAHEAAGIIIKNTLGPALIGKEVSDIPGLTRSMTACIRNNGNCGLAMMAVSAADIALWDLKARILNVPLVTLLGAAKDGLLLYGSGGFTTYTTFQLESQLAGWAADGLQYVKIKIGSHPAQDTDRVKAARNAIGKDVGLFVDANGAFTCKEALALAADFDTYNVSWFEEPVISDDLAGLNFIRKHAPARMSIAAGEYGYNLPYFRAMLEHQAVDILQGDATRCGGITGFLKAGYLCEAFNIPYSSHCAPAVHLHAAMALPSFYVAEYFHDHVRIENLFFEGIPRPTNGVLTPDLSLPGLGLIPKYDEMDKHRI